MCVASFNPGYQQSFKELKPSTRQRFVNLVMDYLDPENEAQVLVKGTGISNETAVKLIRLAAKIRKTAEFNLKETVSTRLLINAAKLMKDGLNPRRACHVSIAEVLSDDVEIVKAIKDIVNLSI
jgi:nitric oxide reductase NorQ protein